MMGYGMEVTLWKNIIIVVCYKNVQRYELKSLLLCPKTEDVGYLWRDLYIYIQFNSFIS